jgi:carbon storage regulator
MLVILRRPGEAILVGEDIEIQVLEVTAGRVKLGLAAPASVVILRKEIHLTNQQNTRAALPVPAGRIAALASALRRSS